MKKFYIIIFFILFLTGCSNKNELKHSYSLEDYTPVYAYNVETEEVEIVDIIYTIEDVEDVFKLYTIYQNNLPLGYVSMGSGNIELLDCKIEDNICYYTVDKYISLADDLEIFSKLLSSTNALLGYKETKIIYNDKIIA